MLTAMASGGQEPSSADGPSRSANLRAARAARQLQRGTGGASQAGRCAALHCRSREIAGRRAEMRGAGACPALAPARSSAPTTALLPRSSAQQSGVHSVRRRPSRLLSCTPAGGGGCQSVADAIRGVY